MQEFVEVALPSGYKTRNKLVSGIGINDAWYITERNHTDGGRSKCPYSVKWKCMLRQVDKLSKKYSQPFDHYLHEDWVLFSNFRKWMETQDWKGKEFNLTGGKFYSPETCSFIHPKKSNLIQGVGVYEEGLYKGYDVHCGSKNGMTKEYSLWVGMLQRCYGDYQKEGRNSTYIDCIVSDNFKSFQFFAEWCNNQIGFDIEGWCLDKDILTKGNKVYSEDACVFIPAEVNTLFNKKKKQRGEYPIGVSLCKETGAFTSTCNRQGKQVWLGYHATVEDAFFKYKTFKESVIKETAERWKNQIDTRAYEALMKYEVEITD